MALKGFLDLKAQMAHKVFKELMVHQVEQEVLDHKGLRVVKELQVLVNKVYQGHKA